MSQPLSLLEKRVLACAQHRATATVNTIAEIAGVKEHTVRRVLERLSARRIITPYCFLNLYPLGLTEYAYYISLAAVTTQQRAIFLKEISRIPGSVFSLELGGEFEYAVSISATDISQVIRFFSPLKKELQQLIARKTLTQRITALRFGRKYLAEGLPIEPVFQAEASSHRIAADSIDLSLLNIIALHPLGSIREIAQLLDIPPSTVSFRLRRLREHTVIAGTGYAIDTERIGAQSYRLLISTATNRDDMIGFCREHPHVVSLVECLGSWDYDIAAEATDTRSILGLLHLLRATFSTQIDNIRVLPCYQLMNRSRYTLPAEGALVERGEK